METSIDGKFTENTEAIVAQFGFKDLKSFIPTTLFKFH